MGELKQLNQRNLMQKNKAYKNMPEYKKLLYFYKKVRFLANYSSMQEVF